MYAVHSENQVNTKRHIKLSSASTGKSRVSNCQHQISAVTR